MDKAQLSFIADVVGVISGTMAIIGLGGLLSWSFFRERAEPLPNAVLGVFVYSLKTGLCLLAIAILLIISIFAAALFGNLVLIGIETFIMVNDFDYNYNQVSQISSAIGQVITLLMFLPVGGLACASIYTWSLSPWKAFYGRVSGVTKLKGQSS